MKLKLISDKDKQSLLRLKIAEQLTQIKTQRNQEIDALTDALNMLDIIPYARLSEHIDSTLITSANRPL